MKGSVDIEKIGVKISGIRQAKTDDLLIEVGGHTVLSRRTTMGIRNFDAATTQEDVIKAIARETVASVTTIVGKSIQQAFACTQVAIM